MPVIPTPDVTASATSSSLVSGHNALWCFISLGLTSMLQPSAFGSKSLAFSPARISPFVCIAEPLLFLSSTAYMFWSGSTPSESIAGFVQTYYQQDRGCPQLWLFRVVVFSLNALPQALIFCGMHGVPWTKTWGFILFFSAIWDGVMQLLAAKYSPNAHASQVRLSKQQKDALGTICQLHGHAAGIAHLGFCCWVFVRFWESNEDIGKRLRILCNLCILLCFTYMISWQVLGFRSFISFSAIKRKAFQRPIVAWLVFVIFVVDEKPSKSATIGQLDRTSNICSAIHLFGAFSWALSAMTDSILALLETQSSFFQSVDAQDTSAPVASTHGQNALQTSPALTPSASGSPSPNPALKMQEPKQGGKNEFALYDSHSPAIALGTLELATIYYLVLFDSEGTRQASWTQVLASVR